MKEIIPTFDKYVSEGKKPSYQVYHSSYSSAVQTAREYAEKNGYDVNEDDWFSQVNVGPGKPNEGSTTKHIIGLFVKKTGKESKKTLSFQVYDRGTTGNPYELNAYIS